MKPTIDIYVGAPISGTEASALKELVEMLSKLGETSLVFANFRCGPAKRQVDFFVVTQSHAAHLELKAYQGPIEAPNEGPWFHRDRGGHRSRVSSLDGSPRGQAIQTKYAICDAMEQFARRHRAVPPPRKDKYFKQIESAVCIFPSIHPDSKVAAGDCRARIWSFEDCLASLNALPGLNNWPLDLWRGFAAHYLRLEKVPLAAAISPQVYEAKSQLEILCSKQADYFVRLIADTLILGPELPLGEHTLVLGRKGVGKTTLAQQTVSRAAAARHLCFFVRAMKYRGDFAKILQQAVSPFSSLSPKDLVQTAELCDARILVVLDGVDQINDDGLREELLTAAAGFFERHPCTVIITVSREITLPPNIQGKTVTIPELTSEDRQRIYKHYAPHRAASIDLSAFQTPQDLKVAAQVAAKLPKRATPALVYDTYIRAQLGQDIASVGVMVCRAIAHEVFTRFSSFLSHQEFDDLAERKLADLGASIQLIDRIKATRLFERDLDGISFAHDLLVNHLVGAKLVHSNQGNLASLKELIAQPLYQQITGEIISRLPDDELAMELLCTFPSVELFECAYAGELGLVLKDRLETFLRSVLDRTDQELDCFELDCDLSHGPDVLQVSPVMTEQVTRKDMCALELIARYMDIYFQRVAEILDRYGKRVLECARGLAGKRKLRTTAVTTFYLHQEVELSPQKLRCSQIAHLLSGGSFNRRKLSSAVVDAFDATFGAAGEMNPIVDFVMCGVWGRAPHLDIWKMIVLFRKCWSSGIYHLQLQATDMFRMQANRLFEKPHDQLAALVQEIDSRLGDDPLLNTGLVELLSMLGSLESPVSLEVADSEVEQLLTELRNRDLDSTNAPEVCRRAYRFVSNIFEEVVSEPYTHAYDSLGIDDKAALLNAAASGVPIYSTITLDWLLDELARLAHPSARSVFDRYCNAAPKWGEPFVGETTKHFLTSIFGLSRISMPLPEWCDESRSPSIAWKLMRDLFYAHLVGVSDHRELWMQLESEDPLGGVSVLLHTFYFLKQMEFTCPIQYHPEVTSQRDLKRLMEIGLKNFDRIEFGDLRFLDPFALLCQILQKVGDEQTVRLLATLTSDQQKGTDAIHAIRKIKQRLRCPEPI
jgi:hypothetical protein